MTDLIVIKNRQAVTSSLQVAESFEKEHRNVLRDIERLKEDVLNFEQMFFETETPDSYGRPRKTFYMNRDGFTLLAMGFNGKKALEFKVKYIEAFNQMEQELLKPRPLSEKEQLIASMKLSLENSEELEEVKKEVLQLKEKVETQLTLDHGEQRAVQKRIASRVYELEQDSSIRPLLFRELHREIKDRFAVGSYKDVKKQDLQTALRYIESWIPKKVTAS